MALRSCIALRAQYTEQFSSWTDKQLKLLDIPFSAAYGKLTSNTFAFPTDLLYLPHKLGGLGLHRTSDGIQAAKYSILQRHLLSNDPNITATIHTLLNNVAITTSQTYPHPSQPITIRPTFAEHNHWVDSLVSFAQLGDLQLTRSGTTQDNSSPTTTITSLHHQPTHPTVADDFSWMQARNMHRLSDLYSTLPNNESSWHDFSTTPLTNIDTILPTLPPMTPPILFPQQLWIPATDTTLPEKTLAEIVGFSPNSLLYIQQWHINIPCSLTACTTDATRSHPRTQLGAATTTLLTPQQALVTYPRRVFLDQHPAPQQTTLYQLYLHTNHIHYNDSA
jgi:hypothetical protein